MDQSAARGGKAWFEQSEKGTALVVRVGGEWTVAAASRLFGGLSALAPESARAVEFDLSSVERMDTAGAWLLYRTARELRQREIDVRYINASEAHASLLEQAEKNDNPCSVEPERDNTFVEVLATMGGGVVNVGLGVRTALGFVGLILSHIGAIIVKPRRLRGTATIYQMEAVGLNALPIVGLISFLIGIVIAYQGAYQLQLFGAGIFTVNLVVVSVLREFGILLTAIMIAGRSGSAFTAEIGSMKLHEEIDAMRALAISPIQTLVIPRFIALTIMMPILTFYSDLVGILGGMIISWTTLDISPAVFIERAREAIAIWDLGVGLIKAPIFGMIIALIGCYEGLCVEGSAESVGQRTTKSVVEAIFMIIVLDAFFAIFFTTIGI